MLGILGKWFSRTIEKIKVFISNMSIKAKLMFCFLSFSIVLVLSIGITSYHQSSNVINQQTDIYSEAVLKQFIDQFEKLMDEIMKTSIPVITNPYIQINDFEKLDRIEFLSRKRQIESEFSSIINTKEDICSIFMCTESGLIFSTNEMNEEDEKNFKEYLAYKKAIDAVSKPVWIGLHKNEFKSDKNRYVLTFTRSVYDKDNFEPFGALCINISDKVIKSITYNYIKKLDYNFFIINRNGETVYNGIGTRGMEHIDRSYMDSILNSKEDSGSFNSKINNINYKIKYIASQKTDWIYLAEIPENYLLKNSNQVKKNISLILILCFIVSAFAAYIVSLYFTIPFHKMIKTMKKVEGGDFNIKLGIENKSEIGQLAMRFTRMVTEIQKLIQRVEQEQMQKREAELDVLQAQITPHFLYNTLNSIKCIAYMQKVKGIEEMTASLIDLLQLSVSKKTVFISIADEIEIVKKYLFLQNFRYGNKFKAKYEIEEEILPYKTVKMILQPLVENSLLHGIESKRDQSIIIIRAFKTESEIIMEVEDNGIGMVKSQIDHIFNAGKTNGRKFSGIGVKNIDERIKMHFGGSYGLSFKSMPGEFTIVSVSIPILKDEEVKENV